MLVNFVAAVAVLFLHQSGANPWDSDEQSSEHGHSQHHYDTRMGPSSRDLPQNMNIPAGFPPGFQTGSNGGNTNFQQFSSSNVNGQPNVQQFSSSNVNGQPNVQQFSSSNTNGLPTGSNSFQQFSSSNGNSNGMPSQSTFQQFSSNNNGGTGLPNGGSNFQQFSSSSNSNANQNNGQVPDPQQLAAQQGLSNPSAGAAFPNSQGSVSGTNQPPAGYPTASGTANANPAAGSTNPSTINGPLPASNTQFAQNPTQPTGTYPPSNNPQSSFSNQQNPVDPITTDRDTMGAQGLYSGYPGNRHSKTKLALKALAGLAAGGLARHMIHRKHKKEQAHLEGSNGESYNAAPVAYMAHPIAAQSNPIAMPSSYHHPMQMASAHYAVAATHPFSTSLTHPLSSSLVQPTVHHALASPVGVLPSYSTPSVQSFLQHPASTLIGAAPTTLVQSTGYSFCRQAAVAGHCYSADICHQCRTDCMAIGLCY